MLIAHETPQRLKQAAIDVSEGVDAIIQCGTNLAFAKVAAMAEFWLEKPVIAINTATYWHALRTMGIRSEEHKYELQSLMSHSYAVLCLIKKQSHLPYTIFSAKLQT